GLRILVPETPGPGAIGPGPGGPAPIVGPGGKVPTGTGFNPVAPDPGASGFGGLPNPVPVPVNVASDGRVEELQIHVLTLHHVGADSVPEIIRTLMPQSTEHTAVDNRTNTLIIRAPEHVYGEIVKLVTVLDTDRSSPGKGRPTLSDETMMLPGMPGVPVGL